MLKVVELLVSHWEVRESWCPFPGFFYVATQVSQCTIELAQACPWKNNFISDPLPYSREAPLTILKYGREESEEEIKREGGMARKNL